MTVRFERMPEGEVAILPRNEYEDLLARASEAEEDAGTARLIARAGAEVEAGLPLLPMVVADRLTDGENALLVLRQWRDLTQGRLAEKTGIGQGHISDIENGRRVGTAATLRRLAEALDVPLDPIA